MLRRGDAQVRVRLLSRRAVGHVRGQGQQQRLPPLVPCPDLALRRRACPPLCSPLRRARSVTSPTPICASAAPGHVTAHPSTSAH
eukprot:413866-Rhodomonas_salina.2